MNIIVFGVGQLGSRHLQGLAGIGSEYRIFAFDPSEKSLQIAEGRWMEMKGLEEVIFVSKISDLQMVKFDVAIIATNSEHRIEAIEILLAQGTKYFLLEKVVFQSTAEFQKANVLFQNHKARAWVNCPRRLYSHYKELQKMLSGEEEIFMTVTGTNWGLGCNAIHFLDLFAFLTGNSEDLVGDGSGLYPGYFESKRAGYFEINGQLRWLSSNGKKSLILNSRNEGLPDLKIQINSTHYYCDINESKGKMSLTSNLGVSEVTLSPMFQSQMTGGVQKSILEEKCELCTFEESMALHEALFKPLLSHFGAKNPEFRERCPIT